MNDMDAVREAAALYRARYLEYQAVNNEVARRSAPDKEEWKALSTIRQLSMLAAYQHLYTVASGERFSAVQEEADAQRERLAAEYPETCQRCGDDYANETGGNCVHCGQQLPAVFAYCPDGSLGSRCHAALADAPESERGEQPNG